MSLAVSSSFYSIFFIYFLTSLSPLFLVLLLISRTSCCGLLLIQIALAVGCGISGDRLVVLYLPAMLVSFLNFLCCTNLSFCYFILFSS